MINHTFSILLYKLKLKLFVCMYKHHHPLFFFLVILGKHMWEITFILSLQELNKSSAWVLWTKCRWTKRRSNLQGRTKWQSVLWQGGGQNAGLSTSILSAHHHKLDAWWHIHGNGASELKRFCTNLISTRGKNLNLIRLQDLESHTCQTGPEWK